MTNPNSRNSHSNNLGSVMIYHIKKLHKKANWTYGLSYNDHRVAGLSNFCYRKNDVNFEIDRTILTHLNYHLDLSITDGQTAPKCR